ncbi:MAG TPA: GNAT family N-acetyltransferase [Tepidisphaeraceae bacterium]|jgi:GNAT superfamily N-acetyltransferase
MLDVRELIKDREIADASPLMHELRPHLRAELFLAQVRRQQSEGYRLFGGVADGRLVVLAGVRDACTMSRGPHLFIDDLVTASSERGRGHGRAMMRYLADHAADRGFGTIHLDSRITALDFYRQIGFEPHTSVPCRITVEALRQ